MRAFLAEHASHRLPCLVPSGRPFFRTSSFGLLTIIFLFTLSLSAAEKLSILPGDFTLKGPTTRQQLVIERLDGKDPVGQLAGEAIFLSSNTNVVRLERNVALPVGNGKATIRGIQGRLNASVKVTVTGMEQPVDWSFRNHVQPVLAKFGCSSGACHGAAAGQNGFKVSLRGYDDEGDYLALTRHALGRRITPAEPAMSLLLLKPTGFVPHKGAKKFDTNSLEYRVLVDWIAAGVPGPKKEDPRVERVEIIPPHVTVKPGDSQQFLVRAHFTDGHIEDVTHWAKYTSANESVSTIDESGKVQVMGFGEGAITAWYLSRLAIATVTAPYTNNVPKTIFTKAPKRNFIDDMVLAKLRSLNLPPSPRCTDEEFIRRAYLDTIGVLPTAKEVEEFLADPSSGKRDILIESLFTRPEFVDYWTYKWSDLLLVSSKNLKPAAMWSYYHWIRDNVAANTPWDEFVRRIVTAQGSTFENGAGNFFVLHDDPRIMAETTTQAFLGMSINCAKCHNHPMEKWTNDQYYQMANLFARVRAKNGNGDGERIIFAAVNGDVVQPLRGKPQPPAPLDGTTLPIESPEDRRDHLADWLVSPSNPYFSRSIANRVWANFMGVGLVESVDDLRVTNPASNEELLSALGKYLAQQNFDLRDLMRLILQSETYQRSSVATPENAADTRFYSRYYPRRLMAEVLLDSISQVTGVPTEFYTDLRNANRGRGDKYPVGFRALQLPDSMIESYFLRSFGRANREQTCECERTEEPSMAQVLHLANGDTINKKLAAKDNAISRLLDAKSPPEKIIDHAYLSALARHPTPAEKEKILQVLATTKPEDHRQAYEDIYWALLSSKEFLFNH
ncbi:MAG: DUF1553 domain-containing protein [Verrucomicrobiota bacterium]